MMNVRVHSAAMTMSQGEEEEKLSKSELKILKLLSSYPEQVFTRDQIMRQCWSGKVVTDSSVTVAIFSLRKKFKRISGASTSVIVTQKNGNGETCYSINPVISIEFIERLAPSQIDTVNKAGSWRERLTRYRVEMVFFGGLIVASFGVYELHLLRFISPERVNQSYIQNGHNTKIVHLYQVQKRLLSDIEALENIATFTQDVGKQVDHVVFIFEENGEYRVTCVGQGDTRLLKVKEESLTEEISNCGHTK